MNIPAYPFRRRRSSRLNFSWDEWKGIKEDRVPFGRPNSSSLSAERRLLSMATVGQARATLDDLYRFHGRAELINGRIVELMASGDRPGEVAGEIFVSLRTYAKQAGRGIARADGVGYAVAELPSGRESFQPDSSYYAGPRPVNRMRFIEGAPTLAVEVRSENDYGPAAEEEMAA